MKKDKKDNHPPNRTQDDPAVAYIKKAIKNQLISLLEEGLEWVIISGQLGTELWAAEVVFELQLEDYPELQLGVITPFLNQEETWKEQNKEWYESILAQADFIDSVKVLVCKFRLQKE